MDLPQPIESKPRPIAITLLCIALFAGGVLSVFQGIAASGDDWFRSTSALCVFVVIVTIIGLWKMRRWAVYIYSGLCILVQVKLIARDHYWDVSVILIQCVTILIMFVYLKRMR